MPSHGLYSVVCSYLENDYGGYFSERVLTRRFVDHVSVPKGSTFRQRMFGSQMSASGKIDAVNLSGQTDQ